MDGFKKLPKMAHFKEGGSVKSQIAAFEKKESKSEGKMDLAQDKAMVKKGVRQHESALHKGEPKTELKLKQGGRAKKAKGTVKKFNKGGSVTNVYEAKKSSGDKDNIRKTKLIKPAKAAAPSKAATKPNFKGSDVAKEKSKPAGHKDPYIKSKESGKKAAAKSGAKGPDAFKKGGKVKKYEGGGLIEKGVEAVKSFGRDIKNNILGTPEQNAAAQKSMDEQAKKGSKLAKFFGGKADAESAPVEKCKGGKIKKYADGGAVLSDEEKSWLGGADATDPFIQARMRAALGDKKPAVKPAGSYIPNANAAMDNRDIGATGGSIDDESKWGNVSPAAAAFNKNIPGAGPAAAAPSAPVRPAVRRPNPAMIEDESKRGIVTPQQQDFNRTIPGSGNAYVAPNVEQDSGVAYPKGGMYANRQPSIMQRFFNQSPADQAASFNRSAEARKNFGKRLGFGGGSASPSFNDQLDALNKPKV